MRRMIEFDCKGDVLAGTLDDASGSTGLFIVSGGNEIRSGAYAGQAAMACYFADMGFPVFRYDRRGVGDSEGVNGGFECSADDIAAAVAAFRAKTPQMQKLVAFGNCDAATALALFHNDLSIDAMVLANLWVIETISARPEAPTLPSAAAIRARYWARLKNPRSLIDLLTGKINLAKLAGGLAKASAKDSPSPLATRLAVALAETRIDVHLLIAERDTTALAFNAVWKSRLFEDVRNKRGVRFSSLDTASHSFSDPASRDWLYARIADELTMPE